MKDKTQEALYDISNPDFKDAVEHILKWRDADGDIGLDSSCVITLIEAFVDNEEIIRAALSSQAEKDRVMRMMADGLKTALKSHRLKVIELGYGTYNEFAEILAEYEKLGVV